MDLEKFSAAAEAIGVLGLKVSQHGTVIAHKTWDEECRRR